MSLMESLLGSLRRRQAPVMPADDSLPELLYCGRENHEAGRWKEAEACFLKALQMAPGHREALFGLGEALRKRGAGDAALACYEQILALWPEDIAALRQSALVLSEKRQWMVAATLGQKVLDAEPQDDKARRFVAVAWRKAGNWPASEKAIRAGLEKNTNDAWLLTELGWTLREHDRYAEAEAALRRAAELTPEAIRPVLGLVAVLQECGREDEAAGYLAKLLADHPSNADVLMVLATQQKKQGDMAGALASYQKAIALAPDRSDAWMNLDPLLFRMGHLDDSMAAGRRAVELDPASPLAHLNLAIGALTLGLFEEGWRHYQWRFGILMRSDYPVPPLPNNPFVRLPGDMLPFDFSGRRVTLVEDQGLGDELSFLRFAPLLRQRGAHVVYVPDLRIASLVDRAGAIDRVTAPGEDAPRDTEVFLAPGDLPLMLGIFRAEQIPPPLTLTPLAELTKAVNERLDSLGLAGKTLVGLTWRGGTKRPRGGTLYKEAPLAEMARLLRDLPVEVLVLQRNPLPGEIDELSAALGRTAHDFSDLNADLEQMLALVDCLDEYVTVSNTNLHLRACAGRSARVLVPFPPDYRWMIEGDESPWFPGIRIYRQQINGDWSDALASLEKDLLEQFESPHKNPDA